MVCRPAPRCRTCCGLWVQRSNPGCYSLFEQSSGVGSREARLPPINGWQVRDKRLTAYTLLHFTLPRCRQELLTPTIHAKLCTYFPHQSRTVPYFEILMPVSRLQLRIKFCIGASSSCFAAGKLPMEPSPITARSAKPRHLSGMGKGSVGEAASVQHGP